jgi:radical SAM protein with 4Fe4S-binding SPASM domain
MNNFKSQKIQYYPDKIAEIYDGAIPTPVQCEITLTTACNYKCPFCVFSYMKHDSKISLNLDKLKQTILQLNYMGARSIVYAGSGEPFLYPHINEVIKYTKDNHIKVGITTNGSMIKDEHIPHIVKYADWIRISINTLSDFKFHNGVDKNYASVIINNITKLKEEILKQKSSLKIGVQSVLTSKNHETYKEIIEMCDKLGVDYYMLRPYYPNPNNALANNFVLKHEETSSVLNELKHLSTNYTKVFLREDTFKLMSEKTYKYCYGLPFIFAIEADGKVYNCFPDRTDNSQFCIGNINDESIDKIWGGEKHWEFINVVMPTINKNNCQPYCRHHAANEHLNDIFNPPDGVEFP